jgi:hypothetical protein
MKRDGGSLRIGVRSSPHTISHHDQTKKVRLQIFVGEERKSFDLFISKQKMRKKEEEYNLSCNNLQENTVQILMSAYLPDWHMWQNHFKNKGFIFQNHIGGFSTKREYVNIIYTSIQYHI